MDTSYTLSLSHWDYQNHWDDKQRGGLGSKQQGKVRRVFRRPTSRCMLFYVAVLLVIAVPSCSSAHGELLEAMMFKFSTDKSRDDHAYVNWYSSILDYRRTGTNNVTEVGVAEALSLQVWSRYFSHATVYGIDVALVPVALANSKHLPNVRLGQLDCSNTTAIKELHFAANSMDMIIDDGPHEREWQESTLLRFWEYLRPGGFYIMEDVDTRLKGMDFVHHPNLLAPFTREVLANHTSYLVDTTLGHRDWHGFTSHNSKFHDESSHISRTSHNSFLVVIRKREDESPDLLHHLMEKSHSERQAFTKVYSSLLDHRRYNVTHVAEIGRAGAAADVWAHFFPNATIIGLDVPADRAKVSGVGTVFPGTHRVWGAGAKTDVVNFELPESGLDVIIDHSRNASQQHHLRVLWEAVRPGGLYVMEFLPDMSSRGLEFLHRPEQLEVYTNEVLTGNFPFFVDTSMGRPEWGVGATKTREEVGHNPRASLCIVIRKRFGAQPPIKNIGNHPRVPIIEPYMFSDIIDAADTTTNKLQHHHPRPPLQPRGGSGGHEHHIHRG